MNGISPKSKINVKRWSLYRVFVILYSSPARVRIKCFDLIDSTIEGHIGDRRAHCSGRSRYGSIGYDGNYGRTSLIAGHILNIYGAARAHCKRCSTGRR